MVEYVKVAEERIGKITGKKGEALKKIEEAFGVRLEIEEDMCIVKIHRTGEDPLAEWKARDALKAIAYGIDTEKALELKSDDFALAVIDLCDIVGRSKSAIERQLGRIIGTKGKAKKYIAEMTGTEIAVQGRHVAILGELNDVEAAKAAVEKLASGAQHSTVYKILEKKKVKEKMEKFNLWR